jgi:hypothetical protein
VSGSLACSRDLDSVHQHWEVRQRVRRSGSRRGLPAGAGPRRSDPCLSTSLSPAEVSGRATLATWTFPGQPGDPYYIAHLPYALAVVELVEQAGLKMVTNLVDYDKAALRADLPVCVTYREVAPRLTLPLFTPVPATA